MFDLTSREDARKDTVMIELTVNGIKRQPWACWSICGTMHH
ncbi:hypothetical protein ACKWRH_36440 [Bradyrhizobium sp. Pa8]